MVKIFCSVQNLPFYYENETSEFFDYQYDIEIYEDNDVRDLILLDLIYLDHTVVYCVGTLPTQFQVNVTGLSS
jgi:protein associated with RNAse G/E